MPTVTYDPALESNAALSPLAVLEPAYEVDDAISLISIDFLPADEADEALPIFRKGGAVPELVVICGAGFKVVTGKVNPDGTYESVLKELTPTYSGISIREGVIYGFAIWLKILDVPTPVRAGIMWFRSPGGIADQIGITESDPVSAPNTEWRQYTVQGTTPTDPAPGAFMVPYIRLLDTVMDIPFYMAGATVYEPAKGITSAVPFAPDKYLTLGDPNEKLGEDEAQGGGLLIGQPGQG